MKRLFVVGGMVAGAAFLAKRLASEGDGLDFGRMIERMPENAPPKWMFRNITEIRENTERILRLLENDAASSGSDAARRSE